MIERRLAGLIGKRLAKFPGVAILGPRQCGKTTLARTFKGRYFDLEQEGQATLLNAKWDELVSGSDLLILDEAHHTPQFLKRLRGAIDAERSRNGRFIVLGSVSSALMKGVSESLAGRMALLELSPFNLLEIGADSMDDLWLFGGYPMGGILDPSMFGPWQESFLGSLISRDLPNWGLPARPRTTERLAKMLAATQGQPMNLSSLGSALSLDGKTVASYVDFLEGAFLTRRLPPFLANIRKRLVKSPRVYWRDSGLLHYLLGVRDLENLFSQPWVGHGWECFVIEQTISALTCSGKRADTYYFRTSDGFELDLVLETGNRRIAVEIKLTSDPGPEMTDRLLKTASMIGATHSVMVCRIGAEILSRDLLVTNLDGWLRHVIAAR